jgi:signal transduction histidine kinase
MTLRAAETDLRDDSEQRAAELAEYGLPGVAGVAAADGGRAAAGAQLQDAIASLQRLAYLAARLCETPSAVINILDASHQHQVAAYGVDPLVCSVEDSICVVVLDEVSTVVVPDAARDERFRANPFVTGQLGSLRLYASAPLVNPNGHVLGRLCVFSDEPGVLSEQKMTDLQALAGQVVEVLELRRRTLTLARAQEELTRSNHLLSEFAGRVSHDLKSPLTSVIGFAESLRRIPALGSDPRAVRFLCSIAEAGRRMRSLIDEMLAFASVGGHAELAPVDLGAVMTDVLADLRELVGPARAQVTVDPVCLYADRHQLRVLLQNLVANAVTYRSPDRGCRVHVRGRVTQRGWTLQVADNGQGIPHAHTGDVLRPLYRLERDSGIAGTGLGLPTCVRVAEAHDGHLTIAGTPGGGTTVTVEAAVTPRATDGVHGE